MEKLTEPIVEPVLATCTGVQATWNTGYRASINLIDAAVGQSLVFLGIPVFLKTTTAASALTRLLVFRCSVHHREIRRGYSCRLPNNIHRDQRHEFFSNPDLLWPEQVRKQELRIQGCSTMFLLLNKRRV